MSWHWVPLRTILIHIIIYYDYFRKISKGLNLLCCMMRLGCDCCVFSVQLARADNSVDPFQRVCFFPIEITLGVGFSSGNSKLEGWKEHKGAIDRLNYVYLSISVCLYIYYIYKLYYIYIYIYPIITPVFHRNSNSYSTIIITYFAIPSCSRKGLNLTFSFRTLTSMLKRHMSAGYLGSNVFNQLIGFKE